MTSASVCSYVLTVCCLYRGEIARSRATVSGTRLRAKSTSSSVVCLPRLKRMLARARSGFNPIARSTCDGSIAPEEQAKIFEKFETVERALAELEHLTRFGTVEAKLEKVPLNGA